MSGVGVGVGIGGTAVAHCSIGVEGARLKARVVCGAHVDATDNEVDADVDDDDDDDDDGGGGGGTCKASVVLVADRKRSSSATTSLWPCCAAR